MPTTTETLVLSAALVVIAWGAYEIYRRNKRQETEHEVPDARGYPKILTPEGNLELETWRAEGWHKKRATFKDSTYTQTYRQEDIQPVNTLQVLTGPGAPQYIETRLLHELWAGEDNKDIEILHKALEHPTLKIPDTLIHNIENYIGKANKKTKEDHEKNAEIKEQNQRLKTELLNEQIGRRGELDQRVDTITKAIRDARRQSDDTNKGT